jgi:tetratricopeptide (TPR) repeat protein
VESHFPDVQAQWKQNISLDVSKPITSISDFAIADSRFFQMSSWDQILIEGLGYSNSFFGFIGRGWAFTVIGLVICLTALYLGLDQEKFKSFLSDMGKFLPWVGIGLGIVVLSLIVPNIVNYQLDSLFAKGQYQQVVATSRTLASWYPPLKGDQAFLKRMGQAGFYANEPDPALINFVKGVERYGIRDFQKAEDYFQRSLAIQPKQFLVKGYLASSILNQGINYFNDRNNSSNHKPGVAADRFEEALWIFPGHIEALYDLMIARVVNGEFEKSASVGKQIIESQKYFQQPILGLLGQAYLHASWASYHDGDLTKAWKQYRQSIDSSTWKKSGEANK